MQESQEVHCGGAGVFSHGSVDGDFKMGEAMEIEHASVSEESVHNLLT